MVLELVVAIFSIVVDYSIAPIGRQIGYVFNYKSNMEKLKKEHKRLTETKEMVQHSVDDATRKGEEIESAVQTWLNNVEKVTEDILKIIIKAEEKEQKWCFKGLCPDLKVRHQLSKKAAKEAKNAGDELQEKGRFDRVSYRAPPQGMRITSVKGYEAFESRNHTLDGVMEALKDASVNMVGVSGMGGVGKTTLVKEVAKKAKQEDLFDMVVMAEVSQNPNTKRIQGEIADMLGLEFHEESVSGRADRLCYRLKKEKRILIVLDDIWAKLDLEAVGIPSGDTHKGCKILLTSRDQNILSLMDTQTIFMVSVLRNEEAWDMFRKMAGDSAESPHLRKTAIKVAEKCAGLPIAIVTVASALKNKSLYEWKNALRELERPSSRNSTGIPDDVYRPIELSYNHLGSEELKLTFLFCGFFSWSDIYYLLVCGMALGLFQGINTMEEARDRVHTLLHNLEASCLLLDSSTRNKFSMHDVVRDVAISIASRDRHMFARRNEVGPKQWPSTDCTAISLYDNDINALPEELDCPKLEFFFISNYKNPSLKIPVNFFAGMRELRVLHLYKMHILSLPSSFHLLANLRALSLNQCMLGGIALVGELKKLEILNLVGSDLEELPKELGQLTQLQCLDLNDCSKLKVIPPGVLSSLSRLEELYMFRSFDQWEIEGLDNQRSNASLTELKHLPDLTTLVIRVRDARIIPKDLFFEKLERYQIYIGEFWDWSFEYDISRTLKLKHCTSRLEDGIYMLLKKTEDLHLDELKGVENVLCKLDREGFPLLKHLHIQNSPEIRYIINSVEHQWVRLNAFPILESLFLHNLINLEKICQGQLTVESFSKLRKIKVWSCGRLRHLFSFPVVKGLLQLQEIEVIDCKNMDEIVAEERHDEVIDYDATDKFEFPQLRSLTLQHLRGLINFNHNEKMHSTSQSRRSMPLFNEKLMFPGLEALKLSSINIGKIWQDQLPVMPSSFQNLGSLILEDCDCLEYLLSSSMARSLVQLKHLEICECKMMQEIVVTEEFGAEERKDMMLFPRLTFLKMKDLQNLTRFCSEENVEFPSLKQLHIENCPELTAFVVKSKSTGLVSSKELKDMNMEECCTSTEFIFNEKVAFPMLEEVVISHMDNLKNIWHNQLSADSFCRLKTIKVEHCQNLSTIFPAFVARGMVQLVELSVVSCGVDHIVAREEGVEAATEFVFPQISVLKLWRLPELKSFYQGIHTSEWPMFKKLDVCHCQKLNMFAPDSLSSQETRGDGDSQLGIPMQQPLFSVEKVIPNLEELTLNSENIRMIQHGEFPADLFYKLKFLHVRCFHDETAIVPLGFLQRLQNLEKLDLGCSNFKELFPYEALVGEEKHAGIFTCIKNLRLDNLSFLKHIWKQDCQWEPVLQKLETLEVWYCHSLINLMPSSASLQNLTTLDVRQCKELINLLTYSAAKSLVQLKIMKITECHMVTEIVSNNEGDETEEEIIFSKLESLGLDNLSNLSCFCLANFNFKFPSLVVVMISGCPKLKNFSQGVLSTPMLHTVFLTMEYDIGRWEGDLNTTIKLLYSEKVGFCDLKYLKLSESPELVEKWTRDPQIVLDFKNLKVLEVHNCGGMRFLFTPSMALWLVRLEWIEIKNCIMMEDIITKEEGAEGEELDEIEFPRLKSLLLVSLPNLTCFYSGSDSVQCPLLERITIQDCPNMKTFTYMFPREQYPGTSDDGNIGSLDRGGLYTHASSFFSEKVAFPRLEEIVISHVSNLKNIWHNQLSADSFCRLKTIKVECCQKLSTVFPASVARGLLQLVELCVVSCGVEYIVAKDEGVEAATKFVFPQASVLKLWSSPELKSFYPGIHTVEWPVLKKLDVYHCDKLKVFAPDSLSFQETHGDCQLDIPIQQPLFFAKKVIPNLEELTLNSETIKMIQHGKIPADLFGKLKFLHVRCFHDETAIVPLGFLQRLQNLEMLDLGCSNFKEIFSYEALVEEEKHAEIFTCIRNLRLDKLPLLKYIWKQDCQWELVLQNLETLEVWGCDSLINLAPSLASFRNLITLNVWQCKGLVNVVTSSTAKSLVQLTKLIIRECHLVAEIVSNNGDESEEEIKFGNLKLLVLYNLPNLSSFCQAHNNFKFPLLEEVYVIQCPNLKIFSRGVLSTPLLYRVMVTTKEDEGRWVGDLNSTVKLLYTEMVGFHGSEDLKLSEFPVLAEIWHRDAQKILDFTNLKVLKVDNCSSMGFLFTPSMVLCLVRLELMKIESCTMMEEVITKGEGGAELDKIVFPRLSSLSLESLPNLTCFYSGSDTLKFPSLERITIQDCPNMKTFASLFLREQDPETSHDENIKSLGGGDLYSTTASFFNEKILFPNLNKLKLSLMNIAKIWPEEFLELASCIQNLEDLTVEGCGSLKYLFPSSMVRSLVQLESLYVRDCKTMERVIVTEELEEEGKMNQMLLPKLDDLCLENLPELTRFCTGNIIKFPSLRQLFIEKCPELKAFISNPKSVQMMVSKEPGKKSPEENLHADIRSLFDEKVALPGLERLIIVGMDNLKKIWHGHPQVGSFGKLHYMRVAYCKNLSNIFPSTMLSRLQRVDWVRILHCASLEVIFEPQGSNVQESNAITATQSTAMEAAPIRFVFPQVTNLELGGLPELKKFYPGMHTTEWPLLKKMNLYGCDKVQIFAAKSFKDTNVKTQLEIPIQQPLFLVDKVTFPNLEELSFEGNNAMKEIWHGRFSPKYFCKLKVLELINFPKQFSVFPCCFLHMLLNLDIVLVSDASFNEIFRCEELGCEKKYAGRIARLSELKLSKLPELMHLWKEECQSDPVFQNLGILQVSECCKLKTLVPSSIAFQNLTSLEVSKCHGLIILVTQSTAKSLVQLTRMSIVNCEMIEEIIAHEGDEIKDGITFSKLKYLRLDCLQNLGSFCSGNYTFEFPSLEEVIMRECPKMKAFSQGVLNTPKLQRLQLTEGEDKGHWAGNFNTTM